MATENSEAERWVCSLSSLDVPLLPWTGRLLGWSLCPELALNQLLSSGRQVTCDRHWAMSVTTLSMYLHVSKLVLPPWR